MAVRDKILAFLREYPGRTQRAISEGIFGIQSGSQQRVNQTIRYLVATRTIRQVGTGGPGDPYTYFIA